MNRGDRVIELAELQGLYGPFQVLEGRIQEIWALESCQKGDWRSRTGRRFGVRHPGGWNRGHGPDFRDAVLEIEGETRVGDVEVHLYREDWWRHGHDRDPTYDNVILHVVLFGGGLEREIRTHGGSVPEEWVMGPWLREDLESVSGGKPGLFGELIPELREAVESEPAEVVRNRLLVGADRRWKAKETMARSLSATHGWTGGLHRIVLYYLGFPHNRRSFLEMAEAIPQGDWGGSRILETIERGWEKRINWGIGRPAGRARVRLAQYIRLNAACPDWTLRLAQLPPDLVQGMQPARQLHSESVDTRNFRRYCRMKAWNDWLSGDILGGRFTPGLVNKLWIDAFLPLLAGEDLLNAESAHRLWFHWPPADFPHAYRDLLKSVTIRSCSSAALCNGWVQGLLWMEDQARIERLRRHSGAAPGPASGSGA